jgi:hypothetical protein
MDRRKTIGIYLSNFDSLDRLEIENADNKTGLNR